MLLFLIHVTVARLHMTLLSLVTVVLVSGGVYADYLDYAMEVHITIKVPRGFLKSHAEVYFNSLRRGDVNNTLWRDRLPLQADILVYGETDILCNPYAAGG